MNVTCSSSVDVPGRSLFSAAFALTAGLVAAGCNAPPSAATDEPPPQVYKIDLVSATVSALPKCTSALAGTTVLVQSPVALYSCQASNWVLIPCTAGLAGAVAYASASQTLLACTSGQWTQIPVQQGPAGPPGPQGPMGATGATGATGPMAPRSDRRNRTDGSYRSDRRNRTDGRHGSDRRNRTDGRHGSDRARRTGWPARSPGILRARVCAYGSR